MSELDVNIHLTNGRLDKLPIRKFSFKQFSSNPSIVMIAKRRSGKSWVVRAILSYFRRIPVGVIIAPTDKMTEFYKTFFPDSYVFYEYKSVILESILKRQEAMIEKEKEKNCDPRCIVVMDDCLAQKSAWANDNNIKELLFNGRHYKIMYMLTMQFPLGITPELRSNFDYIFLLAENFISNKKRMYDHYAGMFKTFDAFLQVFTELTRDHMAMVIVNAGANVELWEQVFWYKAPDLTGKNIGFGCRQFNDFHDKNYEPKWKEKKRIEASKPKDLVDEFFTRKKKDKTNIGIDRIDNDNTKNEQTPRKNNSYNNFANHRITNDNDDNQPTNGFC